MAQSFGKVLAEECIKYLTMSIPSKNKEAVKSLDKEKIQNGVVEYLLAYFKMKSDAKIKDAGIESGTCFNINLDFDEIYGA